MEKSLLRFHKLGWILILAVAVFSLACGGGGDTSNSQSAPAAASPAVSSEAAQPATAGALPAQSPASTASATPNPVVKQAATQPGVPVPVPESMKRALTPEEFQKAMQAMPPEVRQRLMGLQKGPMPSPASTKK
jgi:hypothetical protein